MLSINLVRKSLGERTNDVFIVDLLLIFALCWKYFAFIQPISSYITLLLASVISYQQSVRGR